MNPHDRKTEENSPGILSRINGRISFQAALLFAPLAYCVHHVEEKAGGFRPWKNQYLPDNNPLTTEYVFVLLTAITLVFFVLFAIRKSRATAAAAVLLLMATQVNNAIFHIGAGLIFRDYSPGTMTALFLYLPVNAYICLKAIEEGWLSKRSVSALFVIGAVMFWTFELMGPLAIALFLGLIFVYIIVSEVRDNADNRPSEV